ncbi:hypothetical protein TCDM_11553 [Trypanosoma cruzi Dm28c]|uniref:Uncharacterized protein n=1 Tax=Trypanosoma cruzi Dm28c TaxID=1416333 RepID=V5AJR9_TRYCR|nr:hypothetical protein TCDM_11553 [Trypanosoma cruzi Dm28c]
MLTRPTPKGATAQNKKTRRQGVAVCVALRVSASPGRKKNKTRGKEMCAPPHRPSSHAHTSRLPQRAVRRGPSSCVQQARRTGPSSRACRWVCGWSSWAGNTRHPSQEECSNKQLKEGRAEKKKNTSMVIAPRQQAKKEK